MRDEDTTIHLLGTVHLLRPELEWMTPEIEMAIASADTIVFEADTTSPDAQRELMKFYTTQGFFTDGTQLTSMLSEVETQELTVALETIGLPIEALLPYQPWMAAVNMSVKQMLDEGFDPEAGVEKVIERSAMERGADFAFLETVEEQLGGLAGLGECEQVDFLMATVDGLGEGTATLDLLVDEWADGDVTGLGLMMANPEMLGSQPIYDAMMTDRNTRWVPKITAMLEQPGTILVAVGAGHLAGRIASSRCCATKDLPSKARSRSAAAQSAARRSARSACTRMPSLAAQTIWPPSAGGSPRQLVAMPPAPRTTGMRAATSQALRPDSATRSSVPPATRA